MKVYTQMLTTNCNNQIFEMMGSDGVYILDGRNKIDTWINDSFKRVKQLANVASYIIGFRIMKGERFDNSTCIKEIIL